MRPAPLLLSLLASCSLGPPPGIAAPGAPAGCAPIARGVVGTWVYDRSAMEVRTDGSVLRDGLEGALRFGAGGHATLDVAGSHEEHTFALPTPSQMLDVDADGRGRLWTRVSLIPPYPERCFELRSALVGEWTDGALVESFERGGRYHQGELAGHWTVAEPGILEVSIGARVHRYRAALATSDVLVTTSEGTPVDEDPRGLALVESRRPVAP